MEVSPSPYWRPFALKMERPPLPIKNKTNLELAAVFGEWLVAQRYAKVTQKAYKRVVYKFCHYIGDKPISKVDHMDVRSFLVEMMKRDLSFDGYNRFLWGLRRFFDFLFMGGVVDFVAPRFVRGKRIPRRIPRVLGEAEVAKLIRAAREAREQAIIELLYATGCRVGELVNIHVEDIDFKHRTIRVAGKGKERTVFFGRQAACAVKRYLAGRRRGPLFVSTPLIQHGCVSRYRNYWTGYWKDFTQGSEMVRRMSIGLGSGISRREAWIRFREQVPKRMLAHKIVQRSLCTAAISRILERVALRGGLGRVTAHMLRHSYATHLLQHGADLRHIEELLGHTSIQATQMYTRVVPATLEKTYYRFHPRR